MLQIIEIPSDSVAHKSSYNDKRVFVKVADNNIESGNKTKQTKNHSKDEKRFLVLTAFKILKYHFNVYFNKLIQLIIELRLSNTMRINI